MMEPKVFLNTKVCNITRAKETPGKLFGLELELEGRNVGLQDVAVRGWGRHADGSLRGESVEYTSMGGKDFEQTKASIIELFGKFKEHKVKFNDSVRTSTHVHLNFSDKPVKQVINFFALFTVLEELLQHYSGEDRKGNLFCISSREAEGIIGILAKSVANGTLELFAADRFKYAACNLSTLYKFGTAEVRTMKGASSAEQVLNWVSILNDLYEYSLKMESPGQLIVDLSHLGAEGLLKRILTPENYKELLSKFPVPGMLHYSLMEGARLLQIFAFEWDAVFKEHVDIKEPEVKKRKGGAIMLPKRIQEGPFRHHMYVVYKPNGDRWNVANAGGDPEFWQHGEHVSDDPRIIWDAFEGRFMRDGQYLNWAIHHEIPDEGPPFNPELDEPEEEPDWDFEEERDNF